MPCHWDIVTLCSYYLKCDDKGWAFMALVSKHTVGLVGIVVRNE